MKKTLRFSLLFLVLALVMSACAPKVNLSLSKLIPGNNANPSVNAAAPKQSEPAEQSTPLPALPEPASPANMAAYEGSLEKVYEQVNPSVVNISVIEKASQSQNNPLFQMPGLDQSQPNAPTQQGLGSGFVWDTQGHIVTNNHVVAGANKITVTFSDGSSYTAKLVGNDADSDLAVIKVDAPAELLHPVSLADSTKLKVGQMAIAIGNPFGLEGTMTSGIISALGRSLPVSDINSSSSYTIPDIIQTDAPINPGNSGGVLLDGEGKVIGVTAAIESSTRSSAGIGFVIPSVIVQKVVPVLIEKGSFEHSWLGISGISLNSELAAKAGFKSDQRGVLVVDVTSNSPADKAGIRGSDREVTLDSGNAKIGGDLITEIDGQPVKTFEDLVSYLFRFGDVGKEISLKVVRNNKTEALQVTLAARPSQQNEAANTPRSTSSGRPWLGIQGIDLNPTLVKAMDLPQNTTGVLIIKVQAGSPADKAELHGGYKPTDIQGNQVPLGGDVITSLDGKAIQSMAELQNQLANHKSGDKLSLEILRDGKTLTLEVTLTDRPSQ
jgi:S1-C subfamily serine protease